MKRMVTFVDDNNKIVEADEGVSEMSTPLNQNRRKMPNIVLQKSDSQKQLRESVVSARSSNNDKEEKEVLSTHNNLLTLNRYNKIYTQEFN